MTKLTYAQQLAHPLWQRRRLEILNSANWCCSSCSVADQQLHVHHRQYFKGRMAWEYANSELQVLCGPCHEQSHVIDTRIKQILARVPPYEALALLAGYFGNSDEETARFTQCEHYDITELGELASCLRGQTRDFKSDLWTRIIEADRERALER